MAYHEIETQWMGKMQFNALLDHHTVVMDAPYKSGGEESGTIPKPLVLAALSGCTGMDVVGLLRKNEIVMDDFCVKVTGELSKQHPVEYVAIHIIYLCKADPRFLKVVDQAITDSQEKYCGVSHMLKKAIPITWEIHFNGNLIFNNRHPDAIHRQPAHE